MVLEGTKSLQALFVNNLNFALWLFVGLFLWIRIGAKAGKSLENVYRQREDYSAVSL